MNELQWLKHNRYYAEDIDEVKLQNIFYFTLVWNIFEKECCCNFADIGSHPQCLAESMQLKMDHVIVDSVFKYFKNRYFPNGRVDTKFETFQFGKTANDGRIYKEFVQNKLCDISPSNNDKIQSLLYIAFRLRNNLYHGIKDISKLYDQNENFKQINLFLMEVVDKKIF
jgi:hypothetical protein